MSCSRTQHSDVDEALTLGLMSSTPLKQGDSDSQVLTYFVLNLIYKQILQLLKVITVLGFT